LSVNQPNQKIKQTFALAAIDLSGFPCVPGVNPLLWAILETFVKKSSYNFAVLVGPMSDNKLNN